MKRYSKEVTLEKLEKGINGTPDKGRLKSFYVISLVCVGISFLFFIIYLLFDPQISFLSWLGQAINNEGIKNVTMTVGLTGVIFTWLLQIMGERECGLPISNLLKKVFPEYTKQLALFIGAVLLCIYCSSMEICRIMFKLALAMMFLSALSGIYVMWIMCVMFLFSRDKRRHAAFACLVDEMEGGEEAEAAKWNWCRELPNCLSGGEDENVYVIYFLSKLRESETALSREERDAHIRKCYEFVWEITSKSEPNVRQKIPALIREAHKSRADRIFLLSLYILSLSDLYSEQDAERMSGEGWSRDIYTYIWHYLLEKDLLEQAPCSDSLYMYMAFVSVFGCLGGTEDPESAEELIQNYGNKILDLHERESEIDTYFIWFYRSVNAVSMKEILSLDGKVYIYSYYIRLCELMQASSSCELSVKKEEERKSDG